MADRKCLLVFCDRINEINLLSDEQAGRLFKALMKYVVSEELLPDTEDIAVKLVFSMMKSAIDENHAKYDNKCKKNAENIRKRWNKNNTNVYERIPTDTNDTNTKTNTNTNTKTDTKTNITLTSNKEKKETPIDKLINDYTESEDLKAAIKDFIKFRKAIKAPLTDRALTLCFNKLDQLGQNDTEKISVINQSIERGWKGLFPLKDKGTTSDDDYSAYNAVINQFM